MTNELATAEDQQVGSVPKLPEGWAATALHDLISHSLGGDWGKEATTNDSDYELVAVVRGTEFRSWQHRRAITAARRKIKTNSVSKRRLLEGDLVVEVSGGGPSQPVGRVLRIDATALAASNLPLVCSNFCRQIRLVEGIDAAFVEYFLRWLHARGDLDQIQSQTTNLRNLDFDAFRSLTVLVPPLAEQRRIAEKVEALLARIDATRERLKRVLFAIERFRESVFISACAGHLTEEWRSRSVQSRDAMRGAVLEIRQKVVSKAARFSDPDRLGNVPDEWATFTTDELTRVITSGSRTWSRYYDRGTATFVMAQNVRPFKLDLRQRQAVDPPPGDPERDRTRIRESDLLVTIVGANTGDVCRVSQPLEDHYVCQSVALIRPVDAKYAPFLELFLNSAAHGRAEYLDFIYGEGRPHLSLDQLRQTLIALPSLEEQEVITRRVAALMALADTIERRSKSGLMRADKLPQAILAKAFAGELVPPEAELARREGRDYESAAILLERIRREPPASGSSRSRRERARRN